MVDRILEALSWLPNELYVFVISMLPVVELRGAVPIGALLLDMPFYTNFTVSAFGNMLPIPFILLFVPKVLDFLAKFKIFRPMVEWLHRKAEKNRTKIIREDNLKTANAEEGVGKIRMSTAVFVALMLFVALPVPGTGAWTGALVASLFDLPKKQSFLSILLGVVICGVIMCLASYGVLGFLSFLI